MRLRRTFPISNGSKSFRREVANSSHLSLLLASMLSMHLHSLQPCTFRIPIQSEMVHYLVVVSWPSPKFEVFFKSLRFFSHKIERTIVRCWKWIQRFSLHVCASLLQVHQTFPWADPCRSLEQVRRSSIFWWLLHSAYPWQVSSLYFRLLRPNLRFKCAFCLSRLWRARMTDIVL